jgi:tetratricopeptide (TPR) repeat protein
MNRARLILLLAVASLPLVGCAAPTRQQKVTQDVESVRREATPERLQSRGEASEAVGDLTRAEQYYVAALKGGGDERALTRRLLVVCAADGRYPAAANYGEDYLRRHPDDTEMRFAVATMQIALGDVDSARVGLERVVAERPDLTDAHYALATVLRDKGDAALQADAQLREYLRQSPRGQYAETARAALLKAVP